MSVSSRFELIFIFTIVSLTTVSCNIQVIEGFTGHNVLLPCVYRGHARLPEKVFATWRDRDNSSMLDIRQNVQDFYHQKHKFRGRVESFPGRYRKGNFSITLKNITKSDMGVYQCEVFDIYFKHRVILLVSENLAGMTTPPSSTTTTSSTSTTSSTPTRTGNPAVKTTPYPTPATTTTSTSSSRSTAMKASDKGELKKITLTASTTTTTTTTTAAAVRTTKQRGAAAVTLTSLRLTLLCVFLSSVFSP